MKWLRDLARKLGRLLFTKAPSIEGRCGALALQVAYRRFGHRCSIAEVWDSVRIAKEHSDSGQFESAGHLMCRHALQTGYRAVYFQAKYDRALSLVEETRATDLQLIVGHGTNDSEWRHFSILDGMSEAGAQVFDPVSRTTRWIAPDEFLEMWGRTGDHGGGLFLLAVKIMPESPVDCALCGDPLLAEIACPNHECKKTVPIEPQALLGCLNKECPSANWESLRCPYCGTDIEDLRSWSPW